MQHVLSYNVGYGNVNIQMRKQGDTTYNKHEKSMIHNYSRTYSDILDDMSCRYPLHTRDYLIKLLEQDAAESKGWREEDRTLEEGTSSEEKELSEGVVSVSVIA